MRTGSSQTYFTCGQQEELCKAQWVKFPSPSTAWPLSNPAVWLRREIALASFPLDAWHLNSIWTFQSYQGRGQGSSWEEKRGKNFESVLLCAAREYSVLGRQPKLAHQILLGTSVVETPDCLSLCEDVCSWLGSSSFSASWSFCSFPIPEWAVFWGRVLLPCQAVFLCSQSTWVLPEVNSTWKSAWISQCSHTICCHQRRERQHNSPLSLWLEDPTFVIWEMKALSPDLRWRLSLAPSVGGVTINVKQANLILTNSSLTLVRHVAFHNNVNRIFPGKICLVGSGRSASHSENRGTLMSHALVCTLWWHKKCKVE